MQVNPQNNHAIAETAGRIEQELEANPELVDVLLESGKFQALVRHEMHFSGPLPPPDVIKNYDQILPGSAERIFAMAEKEQAFRHSAQNKATDGAINKDRRGQWMGFTITLIILVIASVFAWRGNTVFAGTLIGLDLIGLATVFVVGRRFSSANDD